MSLTPRTNRLEKGLLVACEHSKITNNSTNFSPSKSSWTVPKEARFSW